MDLVLRSLLSNVQWWKAYPPEQYKNFDCRLLDLTKTVLIKTCLFRNCSVDAQTIHRFLIQPINISELLKGLMNLSFVLNKKSYWFFCPLYNDKNMSVLIEDKTIKDMGRFVAYFAFHYYIISRSYFILILANLTPRHSEYLVHGDCYFFFCSFIVYICKFVWYRKKLEYKKWAFLSTAMSWISQLPLWSIFNLGGTY